MANLLFKINIETESGREISYCDTAFAATTDTNISASAILAAIEGMGSCSYTSNADAPASTAAGDFEDSSNLWLEASLSGTSDTGSIKFTHTDDQDTAQPMKRYRFFGTKVCNVLGLPEGQWTYPQNFHLDDSGGQNYFAGDVAAQNLSLTNGLTMANTATMRSNLRYSIDKTADLFTQFTTGSGVFQSNALLLGYNSETDKYVLDKGDEDNLHINATTVTGSLGLFDRVYSEYFQAPSRTYPNNYFRFTGADLIYMFCNSTNIMQVVGATTPKVVWYNATNANVDFRWDGDTNDNLVYIDASTECVGIGTDAPLSVLHLNETSNDKNGIVFDDDTSEMYIGMKNDDDEITIGTGTTIGSNVKVTINSSGGFGVGATAAATAGHIRATNNIVAYYSDERLKEKINIGIENAIDKIKDIDVFTYKHNKLANSFGFVGDKIHIGVSAHSVKNNLPQAVEIAPFDADTEGNSKSGEDYLTVQYERLVPLLIEGIKEQQKQIETLKARIDKLEGEG